MTSFNKKSDVLIFVHIPKCGGTTLHGLLHSALDGRYHHIHPNDPLDRSRLPRRRLGLSKPNALIGCGGHQPFGTTAMHRMTHKNIRYITLMRDPVERLLSLYKHILRHKHHRFHELAINCSQPVEFLHKMHAAGNPQVSNQQIKMICGKEIEPTFNNALDNLQKKFDIVGCIEAYEAFLCQLDAFFGRPLPRPPALNQAPAGQSLHFDPAALDFIYEKNQDDLNLYNHLFKN